MAHMRPDLNRTSVIRCFKHSDAIEIRDGITFNFYMELPHMYFRRQIQWAKLCTAYTTFHSDSCNWQCIVMDTCISCVQKNMPSVIKQLSKPTHTFSDPQWACHLALSYVHALACKGTVGLLLVTCTCVSVDLASSQTLFHCVFRSCYYTCSVTSMKGQGSFVLRTSIVHVYAVHLSPTLNQSSL